VREDKVCPLGKGKREGRGWERKKRKGRGGREGKDDLHLTLFLGHGGWH